MAKFARLNQANAVLEVRNFPNGVTPPDLPAKGWRWLPYIEDVMPVVADPEVETALPVTTVGPSDVHVTWTISSPPLGDVKTWIIRTIRRRAIQPIINAMPDVAGAVTTITNSRNNTVAQVNAAVTVADAIAAFRASPWNVEP